jgi:hypothetical protein
MVNKTPPDIRAAMSGRRNLLSAKMFVECEGDFEWIPGKANTHLWIYRS